MKKRWMTEIDVEALVQKAIRAAKAWRKRPTPKNRERYDRLFAEIYTYFYPRVAGMVKSQIGSAGTEKDVEELCNDIWMKVWEGLHEFQ
jgi:DNA-directed RNA polymerase specialized sigma24 family protein